MYIKLALVLIFALIAGVFSDNCLSISQIQTGGWDSNGKHNSAWEVTLTNTCMSTICDATIVAESNLCVEDPKQVWSMDCVSKDRYHFPSYLTANCLTNGTYHKFGYIHESDKPAVFSACDIIRK